MTTDRPVYFDGDPISRAVYEREFPPAINPYMTHRERITARCPSCQEPVEVLPDGWLAHHRGMPGVGPTCPPFDTKERLK